LIQPSNEKQNNQTVRSPENNAATTEFSSE
jgi:hypothetical protein